MGSNRIVIEGYHQRRLLFAFPFGTRPRGGYWWGTLLHLSKYCEVDLVIGADHTFSEDYIPENLRKAIHISALRGSRFVIIPYEKSIGQYNFGIIMPPVWRFIVSLFKRKADMVFVNGFSLWSLIAVTLKPIGKWKVIVMYEGSSPSVDRKNSRIITMLRRFIGSLADALISNTNKGKEYFIGFLRVKDKKVFVHPYEVPNIDSLQKNLTHGVKGSDELVFGFVGQLISRKGIRQLIEAINILNKNVQGVKFKVWIIGDGPGRKELERKVQKLGLDHKVHFFGWIDNERLWERLQHVDVFVFPSLEDVWGVAPLEAMALGKPVLCSKYAGSHELIRDGVNGWVFDPHFPEQLAELMERFVRDPSLIEKMGAEARTTMAKFTPEQAARFLADVARRVSE